MFKVYFNDIEILTTSEVKDSTRDIAPYRVSCDSDIEEFVTRLHNNEFVGDIKLYGYNVVKLFNDFSKYYECIEAAGGVVMNSANKFLLINRLNTWDLPKGKIEKGESDRIAAIREVCEETGLKHVNIIKTLPHTFHIYKRKAKWYLKKTYWFLMNTSDLTDLVPQVEEDIAEAVWMDKFEAKKAIFCSYRSIKETLGYYFE